jgi:hypothetical protein
MHERPSALRLLAATAILAAPAFAPAETLVTAPSLVNKTPGADLRLGTADDGTSAGTIPPNASGPNARGAASFALLKQDGSIPANGNDFDYIIFIDGTLDLSPDLATSTASTLVMNITGGTLQTTPEFVPVRTGGTLTGLGGQVSFGLADGSATAQFSAQFSDPSFATAIMNQPLTAAPGMSVVVMRPSFGSSGNAYVDGVLTPLVPANATDLTLIEFTGTASGTVACCMNFGVRGVFAVYGTDGSTTTTTLPPSGCKTFQSCGTALDGTLPPTSSPDRKVRATAKQLRNLAGAARTNLNKAPNAKPAKQKRLFRTARAKLKALLKAAGKAAAKNRLGVPLQPIVDAGNALLALIPAS